jgi:hypothetical protein
VPYKDPEARRDYQRRYKRRQKQLREAQTKVTRRAYLCTRWPNLKLGSIQFRDCFYVTSDWEMQQTIESSELWGTYIVGWAVEPNPNGGYGSQEFVL